MDHMLDFIEGKYHLAVAERMMKNYQEYPEKRFLIGVINETAKAAAKLIRAFLIREGVKGNFSTFAKKVAPKYLDGSTLEDIRKILEIKRAQKTSPVEFARGDQIILLIEGKYRFLTATRIAELVKSTRCGISAF